MPIELSQMLLSDFALPISVAIVVSILTSIFYNFFYEGKRKSDAMHSSVQLWIGNISKNELTDLCISGQVQHKYLLSLSLRDDSSGKYSLSILPLEEINDRDLTYNVYKALRFLNNGQYGAVIREIRFHSGSQRIPLERKACYLIESKNSLTLYMNGLECPDTFIFDYPEYQLIFDQINAQETFIRIPTIKRNKKK